MLTILYDEYNQSSSIFFPWCMFSRLIKLLTEMMPWLKSSTLDLFHLTHNLINVTKIWLGGAFFNPYNDAGTFCCCFFFTVSYYEHFLFSHSSVCGILTLFVSWFHCNVLNAGSENGVTLGVKALHENTYIYHKIRNIFTL